MSTEHLMRTEAERLMDETIKRLPSMALPPSILRHFDERTGRTSSRNFDEPCSVCGRRPSVGDTQLCADCLY